MKRERLSGSVIADANGNWSFGLDNFQVNGISLSQGNYNIVTTYTQRDVYGNNSQPSTAINSLVQLQTTSCGLNNASGTSFAVTCPSSLPIQVGATINNPLIAVTGSGLGFFTMTTVDGIFTAFYNTNSLSLLINDGAFFPKNLTLQETDPSGVTTTISVPIVFVVQVKPTFIGSPLAEAIYAKYCL